MRLNPSDREDGLVLLGSSDGKEKARRNPQSKLQWVGVRADCGVVNSGRWAFCVWNETGGNLRVGWSCEDATLKLGTDKWGFGYGGTATKSHAGQFTKYGQTYGQGDSITCLLDLDRRAILYMKNGREIPGDAFRFEKDLVGWPLFPHVYTKEATFTVSFDGRGGAPPLTGGYKWIANAGSSLVRSRRWAAGSGPKCEADGGSSAAGASGKPGGNGKFVLTPYGWRTLEEAGMPKDTQEWRGGLEDYVKHFTSLLELEYEAEREAVTERVQKKTSRQLQDDGVGMGGLSAEFNADSGQVMLWSEYGALPYLSEITRGRAVLLSTDRGGVDVDDATKTICCEVDNFQDGGVVLSTQYERLPAGGKFPPLRSTYRIDLGPNIVAYRRIDRMLDELQRCLGTSQASGSKMTKIQELNCNAKLTGLLLPGAPLANALYADISESTAAASKWDPLQRPAPNPQADISRASREKDIGAKPYRTRGTFPAGVGNRLNASQKRAVQHVIEERRRFTLIQGPPGTGKTTTAIATICSWLSSKRGPVLASAFSNRGTDNLAAGLHALGVRVLRVGLCSPDLPYSLETRLAEIGVKRGDHGLKRVMEGVDVVAATCIGCGMGPLDKLVFPYVVVDEAAQVIEPAVLLPLGKGAVQAVLVGDQCQLPATVLSQEAQQKGLDISMFDRLLSMGMEYQFLAEQYRMHPKICVFPSWRFYRSELKSGVRESDRSFPKGIPLRAPLAFVHVDGSEWSGGVSKKNTSEAACVAWLAEQFLQALPYHPTGDEVGIITPYAAQVSEIRRMLPQRVRSLAQVSSVDGFQGCEKEFILLSLVRANQHGAVGFVSDWRRLNVAITRARRACVLVGHLPTWLDAENALLRDWISFHSGNSVDFLTYSTRSLVPLPPSLKHMVEALQQEFQRNKPAAAALPRISTAARDVMGLGKAKRQMLEAGRALAAAISSRSEKALVRALSQALEAGVGDAEIIEGQALLRSLAAERELAAAMRSEDSVAVSTALDQAREAGVQGKLVKDGELALERLDALQALRMAMSGSSEDQLRQALERARKMGVATQATVPAAQKLKQLAAASALQQALSGQRLDRVKAALSSAEEAKVDKALLDKARAVSRRLEAEEALRTILTSPPTNSAVREESLVAALGAARQAGAKEELLQEGDAAVRKLEASSALVEAIRSGDETNIYIAIAEAKEAGLDQSAIDAGEAAMHRISVAGELAAAVGQGSIPSLTSAITRAHSAGVELSSIKDAELLLTKLMTAASIAEGKAAAMASTGIEPPAKRQKTQASAPSLPPIDEDAQRQWSLCLIELSVLACRKREALSAEDFDAAHDIKLLEVQAGHRMAEAKQQAVGDTHGIDVVGQHKELELQKRKAIEDEDFDLAAQLKAQQLELQRSLHSQSSTMDFEQELLAVRALKQQAAQNEQFEVAAELRQREQALERQSAVQNPALEAERVAVRHAVRLLADSGPEVLMLAFDPGVASSADSTSQCKAEFWRTVSADLQSML